MYHRFMEMSWNPHSWTQHDYTNSKWNNLYLRYWLPRYYNDTLNHLERNHQKLHIQKLKIQRCINRNWQQGFEDFRSKTEFFDFFSVDQTFTKWILYLMLIFEMSFNLATTSFSCIPFELIPTSSNESSLLWKNESPLNRIWWCLW